jgi:hypothetical protein
MLVLHGNVWPWIDHAFGFCPPTFKRSPSFVIDIGANKDQWIGSLMELLPVTEAWIFEPNPEAMKICRARVGTRPGITYGGYPLDSPDPNA